MPVSFRNARTHTVAAGGAEDHAQKTPFGGRALRQMSLYPWCGSGLGPILWLHDSRQGKGVARARTSRPHECHPRQREQVLLTLLKQTRGRADADQVFRRCGGSCPRRGDGACVVLSRLALTEVTTSHLTADEAVALQRETSRARL
jgi:hypothetical protein